MKSYIFDIDGTLLHTNNSGKQAFKEAFECTFGVNIPDDFFGLSFLGGVDLEIYNKIIKFCNINYVEPNDFIYNYKNLLEKKYNSKNYNWKYSKLLSSLLINLKSNGNILAISTGNFYETAIIKLKEINIFEYFDYIGACEKETNRKDILLKSINFSLDKNIKVDNIYYIGDAIADQEASNYFNIKFIGIGNNIDKKLLKNKDIHFHSIDEFYLNLNSI